MGVELAESGSHASIELSGSAASALISQVTRFNGERDCPNGVVDRLGFFVQPGNLCSSLWRFEQSDQSPSLRIPIANCGYNITL